MEEPYWTTTKQMSWQLAINFTESAAEKSELTRKWWWKTYEHDSQKLLPNYLKQPWTIANIQHLKKNIVHLLNTIYEIHWQILTTISFSVVTSWNNVKFTDKALVVLLNLWKSKYVTVIFSLARGSASSNKLAWSLYSFIAPCVKQVLKLIQIKIQPLTSLNVKTLVISNK